MYKTLIVSFLSQPRNATDSTSELRLETVTKHLLNGTSFFPEVLRNRGREWLAKGPPGYDLGDFCQVRKIVIFLPDGKKGAMKPVVMKRPVKLSNQGLPLFFQ